MLVGYKKSSRDVYVQRLSGRGYVTGGRTLHATEAGRLALGDGYTPLPTGQALIAFWLDKLPEGERRIFELLLSDGPSLPRETIREATGKKKSSTDVYLQRLKARGLVADADRGAVRLSL